MDKSSKTDASALSKYVRDRWQRPIRAAKKHGGGHKKGVPQKHVRHIDLELKLEIFLSVREPGRQYSQQEIADVCGCSRGLIWTIEKRAMQKLRRALNKIIAREDQVQR